MTAAQIIIAASPFAFGLVAAAAVVIPAIDTGKVPYRTLRVVHRIQTTKAKTSTTGTIKNSHHKLIQSSLPVRGRFAHQISHSAQSQIPPIPTGKTSNSHHALTMGASSS